MYDEDPPTMYDLQQEERDSLREDGLCPDCGGTGRRPGGRCPETGDRECYECDGTGEWSDDDEPSVCVDPPWGDIEMVCGRLMCDLRAAARGGMWDMMCFDRHLVLIKQMRVRVDAGETPMDAFTHEFAGESEYVRGYILRQWQPETF